jgi:hypothetical protein
LLLAWDAPEIPVDLAAYFPIQLQHADGGPE